MNEDISIEIDYDINNGIVERAYLILNGELKASGVKITFTKFRASLGDFEGGEFGGVESDAQ